MYNMLQYFIHFIIYMALEHIQVFRLVSSSFRMAVNMLMSEQERYHASAHCNRTYKTTEI